MRPYVAERPNGRLPKPNHQMLFLVSDGIAALEACTLVLGLWLTRRACSAVLADASKGIFENQLLVEQSIFDELGDTGSASTLLDMGCGRGRIS